ncbi:diaminopimelate epimerase [Moryella indoligenes]|uniref:Diaminopimelate epimerase n=1 Tax=Moryella indoligenes TaxID=371674 RepID=A0AAE3VAP5_9FIRM|nr:diaminopimelate epimerase [Moryella indoligenes]MDQ0152647.1 diaminopimelate epimerase [Moryella indoligenes]
MKFTKMQGIGNDYVYVDCFEEKVEYPSELAVRVSDRHFGIGSDGLILICPSERADLRMRMFNADGSEGKMCGNGARCVGKYAYDHGICRKREMLLETAAGLRSLEIHTENGICESVTVDMGEAVISDSVTEKIHVNGSWQEMIAVQLGNPHAVYYVSSREALLALPLSEIGPLYEHHPRFPEGVNSEFIYVEDRQHLHMRVWERGSGETLACGTGATASACASMRAGLCDRRVTVHLLGGDLLIEEAADGHYLMTGPAVEVFQGEIKV